MVGAGWHLLAYTLPWVRGARAGVGGSSRWLWAWPNGLWSRSRPDERAVWQAALMPLSPLAAAPIVARALRRKQRWKGRVYS